MRVARTGRTGRESGQIVIIFAMVFLLVLSFLALAIDGGFGFLQDRRDQNAADFSAIAATRLLLPYCTNQTSTPASIAQITGTIEDIIPSNDPQVDPTKAGAWTGSYVTIAGATTGSPGALNPGTLSSTGSPPPDACGVTVAVNATWPTFFAKVIGFNQLHTQAVSSAIVRNPGPPIGIISLAPSIPHAVYAGADGAFVVNGNLETDSQPAGVWSVIREGPAGAKCHAREACWDDVFDLRGKSSIKVTGTVGFAYNINSPTPTLSEPLDKCFGTNGSNAQPPKLPKIAHFSCTGFGTSSADTISAAGWVGSSVARGTPARDALRLPTQVYPDLLDPKLATGCTRSTPPDPIPSGSPPRRSATPPALNTDLACIACPGQPVSLNPPTTRDPNNGATVYHPGIYNYQVNLLGTTHYELADCNSGGLDAARTGYPGGFAFIQGLNVNLTGSGRSSGSLNGYNVMLAIGRPLTSVAGLTNVTGTAGDGAPKGASVRHAAASGAAGSYSVGRGMNYSLMLGGTSDNVINLVGPSSGTYHDIAIQQSDIAPGNFGMNALIHQDAKITIGSAQGGGVIYDACHYTIYHQCIAGLDPDDMFRSYGSDIMALPGGTLQVGIGSGVGITPAHSSAGEVVINGIVITDIFNTDGFSKMTINAVPYDNYAKGNPVVSLSG